MLLDWYNGSQVSEFIGDPSLHALIFDSLASLQVVHCQVLVDLQDDELMNIWNNDQTGTQTGLCGPGIARSFVSQILLISFPATFEPACCLCQMSQSSC